MSGQVPADRVDDILETVASLERRRVLRYLEDDDETDVPVPELAALLSGWRAADETDFVDPDEHMSIMTRLYHVDLPKLAEVGLIEFDRRDGTVRTTSLPAWLTDVLRVTAAATGEDKQDTESRVSPQSEE